MQLNPSEISELIKSRIQNLDAGAQMRTQGTVVGFGSFFGVRVKSSVPIVAFQGHFDSGLGGGFGTLGTSLGTTGLPA